jgi:arsenite-transporting ATPase
MEEQLSGSCTVEIAAFNAFSQCITGEETRDKYDCIIFDTAPTGHTLRLLQLPSAWNNFIGENTHGASCLGQLSGLQDKKEMYANAVKTLINGDMTTVALVSRAEKVPLEEAARASTELAALGVHNQILIINGVMLDADDDTSKQLYQNQQAALLNMPDGIKNLIAYEIPLRGYNIIGINGIRAMLTGETFTLPAVSFAGEKFQNLQDVIDDLYRRNKKVIFTMGKGGVGKTTIAATIARGLSAKGENVHITTTDPAAHLRFVMDSGEGITMSHIDEQAELAKYRDEILSNARKTMPKADIAYIEEDLRSPCTQEIAVFRAFAEIVDKAEEEIVVIDTAPTGHTLLLLDSTMSYHREVQRTHGDIPEAVKKLLPRLRGVETETIIVTLAEATPVYEALRLEEDLTRAGIAVKWWVINASFCQTNSSNELLKMRAQRENEWVNKIAEHTEGNFALIPWKE